MRFLACESEARKVDLGVKNKWRHDWLQTEDNLGFFKTGINRKMD